jgi:tetratricopeptide (TPR) repeat protein
MIRTWSNPARHAAEQVRLTPARAENQLVSLLEAVEWFYCECVHGPRLQTIYGVECHPITLHDELERLRRELIHEGQRRRELEREIIVGLRFTDVTEVFKDRQESIADLRRLLAERGAKLICLVGPGGIGKTALLSRLCAEIEAGDLRLSDTATQVGADGIVYMSCRGTDKPTIEKLFHDFGRVLGPPHTEEIMEYWKDSSRSVDNKLCFLLSKLRRGYYLLVLDNLEETLGPDNAIADVGLRAFVDLCLTTPHALRLIATSRERVLVGGASSRAVRFISLERGLPDADAVALLRDLDPDGELRLKHATEELLLSAARRCYGVPRALETIAGILANDPALTLEELLQDARLFDERILENLIQEHYSRTTPDKKRVLEALAVYDRPVPSAAIRYLLLPSLPALNIEGQLRALVQSYFVTHQRGRDTYELHPLDQQFIYCRIPYKEGVHNRCALHFRAAGYFRQLRKPEDEWKAISDLEPQLAEFQHLVRAGNFEEACKSLNQVDPRPLAVWGYYQLVAEMRKQLTDRLKDVPLAGLNWGQLGLAVFNLGETRYAINCFERSLQVAITLENKCDVALRKGNLGEAFLVLGEVDKAFGYFQEAYESFLGMGLKPQAGFWLGHLGLVSIRTGLCDTALKYFGQALTIAREVGDRRSEGSWLSNLGDTSLCCGDTRSAIGYYAEAVRIARELNDRRGLVARLCGLARAMHAVGNVGESIIYHKEAIELARAIKSRYGEAKNLLFLGKLYHETGDVNLARACYTDALALDAPEFIHNCLSRLGVICLEKGELAQARDCFGRAISTCLTMLEKTPRLYDALNCLALSHLGAGEPQKAVECYRRAFELCSAKGIYLGVADDLRMLDRAAEPVNGLQQVLEFVLNLGRANDCR